MRKNLLIIIPSIILLILSAIFITISIVVITNKKKGISIVKATEVVEEDNFEFTYEDVTYYCHNVKKDKKNNFIIEEGGFIKIKSPKHDIIGFNNGDKLNVLLEGNNERVILDEGKKSDSLYKYNISKVNFELYVFVIENVNTDDINIGYIRYWG